MTGYWLITYQVSRNDRATWQTWNDVINYPHGDWLIEFYKNMKRTGYTNVVLLNALEITKEQYDELVKRIEA